MFETVRAFIALNLEVNCIRKVAQLQRSLRSSPVAPASRASWVSPANMHITLRFLGDIDAALVPAIADHLRPLIASLPPIRVTLPALDAFPNKAHAKIVVLEVEDSSETIKSLASKIESIIQGFGFVPEKKSFRSHMTLVRLKDGANVEEWLASVDCSQLGEAKVSDCAIYRSDLLRTGAEYSALERFALATHVAGRSVRPSKAPRASQRPGRLRTRSGPDSEPRGPEIPGPPKLPSLSPAPPDPVLEPEASSGASGESGAELDSGPESRR
jgi:2'-5' RNA ligase